MVILDNDTRWNSQYNSIKRSLQLRERINTFCARHTSEISKNILTDDDWNHLNELYLSLEPFFNVTQSIQGKAGNGQQGSIWEWLPAVETLLRVMEDQIETHRANGSTTSWIAQAHQRAWELLTKYYKMSDNCQNLYAAATLLVPQLRIEYFNTNWPVRSHVTRMASQVHKE